MPRQWTMTEMLQLGSSFQPACVLAAAADLDLFTVLSPGPFSAAAAAAKLGADLRGLTILLDALAALGLLDKQGGDYTVPPTVVSLLTASARGNVLAMAQHQADCLRRWSELARAVKAGQPPEKRPSIRGEAADYASFIEAMDNVSAPMAPKLVAEIQPFAFRHLLDIGGASGTWTVAFLGSQPDAEATIFDLPVVIPQSQGRIAAAGLGSRVRFVTGDFYADPLPPDADLALVSAIIHQNSRRQNRDLFAKVFAALVPGGRILIRDMLMDESRTTPVAGALFAVNMLTGTPAGGTFTFAEIRDDLMVAGFAEASILRRDETMNCLVLACKPA